MHFWAYDFIYFCIRIEGKWHHLVSRLNLEGFSPNPIPVISREGHSTFSEALDMFF